MKRPALVQKVAGLVSGSLVAALTPLAIADFTISQPALMHSAGALGNAGNSVFLYTYTGPDAVVTGGAFAGAISSLIDGTLIGEARWNVRNLRFATTTSVSFQPSRVGYFQNSVLVIGYPGGGMILKTGDVLRMETFEAFDDGPGSDAVWNDVTWSFATTVPTDLGTFESVQSLRTSGGTGFGTDTELGLFSSDGTLLRWNDDANGGAGSEIAGLALADGIYYACVMAYDAGGTNGLVRPGFAGTGPYSLAVNGATEASGELGPYSNHWYSFRIGPACPADFNADGFVDGFDYDDFVACFEGASCPSGTTADFNGDGFADGFDYDDFVTAFEAGCL